MRKLILAALTSGFLLSGTYNVLADECPTLAQARAANPNSYLAYRVVGAAHCWFAGEPRHRNALVTEKRKSQTARPSNEERFSETRVAEAPIDFHNTYELDTAESLSDQSPYPGRIDGTFSAIGLGAHSVEIVESIILGRDATNVEVHPIQPADRPWQRGPPGISEVGYFKLVAWLLLTIGVGSIMAGVLRGYGDRFRAQLRRHIESWLYAQRVRVRDYPSARTPLVKYIAYLEPTKSSVDAPSRNARPQDELTSISSVLRRIG